MGPSGVETEAPAPGRESHVLGREGPSGPSQGPGPRVFATSRIFQSSHETRPGTQKSHSVLRACVSDNVSRKEGGRKRSQG